MTSATRIQNKYDYRLRELVRSTSDADDAIQRGVPRRAARGWLTSTRAEVVTLDIVDMDRLRLQQEVLRLQIRVDRLVALLRLVIVVLKVSRHDRDHILQLAHRIVAACAQTPMVVFEHARRTQHAREADHLLRGRAQRTAPSFGVPWSDAGRDVLRHGERHSSGT